MSLSFPLGVKLYMALPPNSGTRSYQIELCSSTELPLEELQKVEQEGWSYEQRKGGTNIYVSQLKDNSGF